MSRGQSQLDLAEPSNIVFHDDWIIILEIQADIGAQRRALGEEHQILEHEVALDDLIGCLGLCDSVLSLAEDGLLLGVVTTAPKRQFLRRRLDLHQLSKCMHVPDDLLEVRRWHRDYAGEFNGRDLDGINVDLDQLQAEPGNTLLLSIQDLYPELRGILLVHEEHDAFIVGDRLDELEEVDHVDAEHVLLRTVVLVEAVRIQSEVHQDGVGAIHCHDLHALTVELDVGIREDILDGFDEGAKGGGLDGADAKQVVGIHSTAAS